MERILLTACVSEGSFMLSAIGSDTVQSRLYRRRVVHQFKAASFTCRSLVVSVMGMRIMNACFTGRVIVISAIGMRCRAAYFAASFFLV